MSRLLLLSILNHEVNQAQMGSTIDKILKKPVYYHILAVLVILCIIVYAVLHFVDKYTNHNQAVYVPDVKGLQIENAKRFFEDNMLRYNVIDSVFRKDITPGAIVELTPRANSKVKKNRIVYITINAKTEETIIVPDITDMSFRQSIALLRARGFQDVEWKYVTSEYRDLTIGIEYGGQMINGGTRVPKSAKLIIILGDGNITHPINDGDTIEEEKRTEIISGDESWF